MAATLYGESQAARYIQEEVTNQNRHMHKSNYLGQQSTIRGELADVWNECRQANWDGYGALAVDRTTVENTQCFLLALPLGTPMPSVGAEPDGQIALEWHRAPRRTLSVSISPQDEVHYAALLGPGKTCGSEPFVGSVPRRILDLLSDVYSC